MKFSHISKLIDTKANFAARLANSLVAESKLVPPANGWPVLENTLETATSVNLSLVAKTVTAVGAELHTILFSERSPAPALAIARSATRRPNAAKANYIVNTVI